MMQNMMNQALTSSGGGGKQAGNDVGHRNGWTPEITAFSRACLRAIVPQPCIVHTCGCPGCPVPAGVLCAAKEVLIRLLDWSSYAAFWENGVFALLVLLKIMASG